MENKTEVVRFRCSPELKTKIERAAQKDGRTVSNFITNILSREIKEEKNMKWLVKDEERIIGSVVTNNSMTDEEICEMAGIKLAHTQEEYENLDSNGMYDLEALRIVDASHLTYKVENYNENSETTTFETEHETLEQAEKEYERRCEAFMEPADCEHTIIILSQTDEEENYGSIKEFHK